jgi:hypothetical protein
MKMERAGHGQATAWTGRLVDWAAIAAQMAAPQIYSVDGTVTVEQALDGNIYGAANDRKSDFITHISPRRQDKMQTKTFTGHALGSAKYGRYASHHDKDYLDGEIGADAVLCFFDGVSAFGGIEHAREHDDRDSPDDAQGISSTEYRRLGGWAGFEA